MKRLVLALLSTVVVALPAAARSQSEMAIDAERVDFTSSVNGRPYRLLISVPARPAPPDGYPVVYLIDGNLHFGITVDTARIQARWPEVRDPVIVGIGYPTDSVTSALDVRNKDLTSPTSDAWLQQGWVKEMRSKVEQFGGVDAYLATIEREVKPRVAARVKIDPNDQTLMGHSLGGLTTLYALFTAPSRFRNYVAVSPSIWWDGGAVLAQEAQFTDAVKAGKVDARVMISVGGEESTQRRITADYPFGQDTMDAMTAGTRMVPNTEELGSRLKALTGPTFTAETVVFDRENHNSVPAAGLARGIRFTMTNR